MRILRVFRLPLSLVPFLMLGCNGGDLGPGSTHVEDDATEEDMAGMDMAAPTDGTATADTGPTASDGADVEDMAGMDMNASETAATPETSGHAGMEM